METSVRRLTTCPAHLLFLISCSQWPFVKSTDYEIAQCVLSLGLRLLSPPWAPITSFNSLLMKPPLRTFFLQPERRIWYSFQTRGPPAKTVPSVHKLSFVGLKKASTLQRILVSRVCILLRVWDQSESVFRLRNVNIVGFLHLFYCATRFGPRTIFKYSLSIE
jgi:hypothetical protein